MMERAEASAELNAGADLDVRASATELAIDRRIDGLATKASIPCEAEGDVMNSFPSFQVK